MAIPSQFDIENTVARLIDPHTERDLGTSKVVKTVSVADNEARIKIILGYPAKSYHQKLISEIKQQLLTLDGIESVHVEIASEITSHSVQKNLKPMPGVKNIIAIASGKGGVGKSTTAVNIALALVAEGANAGILDADIYGPSQPLMLGISGSPESKDGKTMEPKVAYGLQSISMGYLVDDDTPMIWRGPMVTGALQQLLNNTNWSNLDYLIVDLPPGTGDIQLTLSQQIPVSGAVIVTTPQDIALLDAQKGLKMFEKVDVPVLGIVENMSTHICSECGHEEPIFGSGGGETMAKKYAVDLLGALPLDIDIRKDADRGLPSVASDPDSKISAIYREIARKMTAKLALRAKDHSGKFPSIVVQND